jgi:hypothetical protein
MNSVQRIRGISTARRRKKRAVWLCALIGFAASAVTAVGLLCGHAQSAPRQAATPSTPVAAAPPSNRAAPTAELAKQPAESAAVDPQKQEITSECANLLQMATALKSEVDKTTKDQLSVTVVRKAGEIEQLAHKVRLGTGKG